MKTQEVVWRHPKGRFDVVETSGINMMGDHYTYREAVLTPRRDARGMASEIGLPDAGRGLVTEALPKRRAHLTEEERARILQLARDGRTATEIARETGRSVTTVNKVTRGQGVRVRQTVRGWTQEEIDTVRRLRDAGRKTFEISAAVGRTAQAVRGLIDRYRAKWASA